MTTITLSHLKDLGSIDNPLASPMERALMHAIDSRPEDHPDGFITAEDEDAFTAAFPWMGELLDASEQAQLLSIFETTSKNAGRADNLSLIAAARASASPYAVTVTNGHAPDLSTATALPSFVVGYTADGTPEGVWQVAERVKSKFPALAEVATSDVVEALVKTNNLSTDANGQYVMVPGQDLLAIPTAPGVNGRLSVAFDSLINGLGDETARQALIALKVALPLLLILAATNPAAFITTGLAILGTTIGVAQGYGVLKYLLQAAIGSGDYADNAGIRKWGDVVREDLAGVGITGTTLAAGKALQAYGSQIRALAGQIAGLFQGAGPVLESAGTLGANTPVVARVNVRALTLGSFPVVPSGAKSIFLHLKNQAGETVLLEITAPRDDIADVIKDYANGNRFLPQGYKLPDDGLVYLSASSAEGAPIYHASPDQIKTTATTVFDQVGLPSRGVVWNEQENETAHRILESYFEWANVEAFTAEAKTIISSKFGYASDLHRRNNSIKNMYEVAKKLFNDNLMPSEDYNKEMQNIRSLMSDLMDDIFMTE